MDNIWMSCLHCCYNTDYSLDGNSQRTSDTFLDKFYEAYTDKVFGIYREIYQSVRINCGFFEFIVSSLFILDIWIVPNRKFQMFFLNFYFKSSCCYLRPNHLLV